MSVELSNITSGLDPKTWINTYSSTGASIYNYPDKQPIIVDHYTSLCNAFNLELTQDQLSKLNELQNSGDEANRIIAANLFKYMIDNINVISA